MPEIGEIKQGQAIGKAIWHAHIWHACLDCGEERWVLLKKGKPEHLRCRSCARQRQVGVSHPRWRGGRLIDRYGYINVLLQPDDFFYPMTDKWSGYVREHRLVVAKALGRCLLPWEVVHHKGKKYPLGSIENKQDNRFPENLELLPTPGKHNTIMDREFNKQAKLIKELQTRVTLLEAELTMVKHNEPYIAVRPR